MFDPGPDGYIGDVSWIIKARESGRLPLLVVQGVLMTALAKAADIVLPGASWVEKDGAFVNGQGSLQAASRAITLRETLRKTGKFSSTWPRARRAA